MQQCLSDAWWLVVGGGVVLCTLKAQIQTHEICNPSFCFRFPLGGEQSRGTPAQCCEAVRFSRCWWGAGDEFASLLRFVIWGRLPAAGAASSQMTRSSVWDSSHHHHRKLEDPHTNVSLLNHITVGVGLILVEGGGDIIPTFILFTFKTAEAEVSQCNGWGGSWSRATSD